MIRYLTIIFLILSFDGCVQKEIKYNDNKISLSKAMGDVVEEILTTGAYAVGLPLKDIPDELAFHMGNCDLIISKGMGNFEALSEMDYKPILYLLRTKCNPVANALGLPKHLNVAKLFE